MAARLGRDDLVSELLALGADSEATDTAGRTALRVAVAAWLDQRGVKAAAFERVWEQLAIAPLKLKLGDRMVKLALYPTVEGVKKWRNLGRYPSRSSWP